jgi:L-malate glycosyltransferase
MKVLHIIDSLGLGGAQTVVKGILEYQQENKDIFLYALRKREITTEIKHANVKIFESAKKYSLEPLFELKKLVQKEKIDILHCHLFRSNVFGWLLKIIWFPKIRLIFHEHGEIFQNHILYNLFVRLSKKNVDKFIAVSRTTKEELVKKVGILESKINVLSNFVDLEKFSRGNITWNIQKERERLGINKEEFVIGFVGRLAKVKGCEYLIKSLPYLDFKYKVLISGDGPERITLEKLAGSLKVSSNIIFLGYRKDIVFVYSLLDVLVVPSLCESFGLSVVESQAMGIPVIVSNVDGLNEIVNDQKNGLIFKVKDHGDLAEKITILKNNYLKKESIVKNAYIDVRKYSLDNYLNNLNKIYGQLK